MLKRSGFDFYWFPWDIFEVNRVWAYRIGAVLLSQIIFTTHLNGEIPIEDYIAIGVKNDTICNTLGFTGRLFVVENEHLNIIEGPSELNENYYTAFVKDPRASSTLRHFSQTIETREFPDYGVWAKHSAMPDNVPPEIKPLTQESLNAALVPNLSVKLRLIIDGYIGGKL